MEWAKPMIRCHIRTLLTGVTIVAAFGPTTATWAQAPTRDTDISAPLVYEGTMLVFVTDKGVAAAVFRPTARGGAAYDFQFEGNDGNVIEKANIPLFEERGSDGKLPG